MTECNLDDDGGLSSDFIAVEGVPGTEVTPQSLWIGVRPVYDESGPSQDPMVQICYQEEHGHGPLSGPVWITPAVWRELNHAVEWRLKRRRREGRNMSWHQGWEAGAPWFTAAGVLFVLIAIISTAIKSMERQHPELKRPAKEKKKKKGKR